MQKRFNVKRCIFVGDNAMATPENIELLRDKNYEYITSLKLLRDSRALNILKSPSLPQYKHFTKLKDNLYIHEIILPGNEFNPDERIIICYNPERAQVTRRKLDEKLNKSRDYLQSIIDKPPKRGRRKQPEKIIAMVERNKLKLKLKCFFRKNKVELIFLSAFRKNG